VPRSRKRRLDAERSRAAVLDAAITLLGRRADASIEDIAAAAGVVRQTVYAHFPSRGALLAAVVEHITTETARTLDELDLDTVPLPDALRRWLEASWGIVERFPLLLSPVMATVTATGDQHEQHRPVTARLTELIHQGRRAGVFDAGLPEGWVVSAVIALGHAAGQEVIAGRMSARDAGAVYRDSVLRLVSTDMGDRDRQAGRRSSSR
jgi:AcrR family transcriptional regulator